jgi:predicted Fe-S protein YdhL (DUF1289 family)
VVPRALDEVFGGLTRSPFRSRFRLNSLDRAYLRSRGLKMVLEHGRRLVEQRLAPAAPPNDGRQTPYKGHPIFVAQHATGTCCRGCLEKWHHIAKGHQLSAEEQDHVLAALERWLRAQNVTRF